MDSRRPPEAARLPLRGRPWRTPASRHQIARPRSHLHPDESCQCRTAGGERDRPDLEFCLRGSCRGLVIRGQSTLQKAFLQAWILRDRKEWQIEAAIEIRFGWPKVAEKKVANLPRVLIARRLVTEVEHSKPSEDVPD